MSVRIVMGAWRGPRPRDIGPNLIEIDFARQQIQRGECAIYLPRKPFRLVSCILAVAPNLATYGALEISMVGDSEDGGPLAMRPWLHQSICGARRDLACLGISFAAHHSCGFQAVISDEMPPPEAVAFARAAGSRRRSGIREAVPAALARPARSRAQSTISSDRVGNRP